MTGTVIVDTGLLVAFFDRDEKHRQWIHEQAKRLEPGLVTCEAVMAEAVYLALSQTFKGIPYVGIHKKQSSNML